MPARPDDGHGAARRGRGRAGASPGKGRLQPRGGGRAGRGSRARRGRCRPRGGRGVPAPPAASPLSGGGARTPERAGTERAVACAGSGGEPAVGCGALLLPRRAPCYPQSRQPACAVTCHGMEEDSSELSAGKESGELSFSCLNRRAGFCRGLVGFLRALRAAVIRTTEAWGNASLAPEDARGTPRCPALRSARCAGLELGARSHSRARRRPWGRVAVRAAGSALAGARASLLSRSGFTVEEFALCPGAAGGNSG